MGTLFYMLGKMLGVFSNTDCLRYLFLLYVLGAVAVPLSHRFLDRTKIAWLAAGKTLGLGLLSYAAWVLCHNAYHWSPGAVPGNGGPFLKLLICLAGNGAGVAPYRAATLYVVLAAGAGLAAWGYKRFGAEMARRLRRHWRAAAAGEAVFLAAFAFCAVLRMHSPGIKDQEKFMDFAFLNSCIYNRELPPPDPWRYDLPINYYYGGYMQMANLAKMTAVRPEVAYNVSVAVVFALACQLAFAIGFELTPRLGWALLAVVAVALMGNLDVAAQNWLFWIDPNPGKRFAVDWWGPSRVIHDGFPGRPPQATINEFPFFSFVHADLHPHVMAIPHALLFLCALANLLGRARRRKNADEDVRAPKEKRGLAVVTLRFSDRQALELPPVAHGKSVPVPGFPPVFPHDSRPLEFANAPEPWRWARLALTGWALGSLAMINGFDFIVYSFVFLTGTTVREWLAARGWRNAVRLNWLGLSFVLLFSAAAALYEFRAALARVYAPDPFPSGAAWLAGILALAAGALAVLAVLLRAWLRQGRPASFALNALAVGALGMVVAVALFAPFFLNYHAPLHVGPFRRPPPGTPIRQVLGAVLKDGFPIGFVDFRSGLREFGLMWGTQLFVAMAFLIPCGGRILRRVPSQARSLFLLIAAAFWLVFFSAWGHAAAATLPFLAAWALWGLAECRKTPSRVFVFLCIGCASAVLFACEQVYVRDDYGAELQRMNTLFKFYYPCGILLGVSLPFGLRELARTNLLRRPLRWTLVAVGCALLAWACEYPVYVSWDRIAHYRTEYEGPADLDGMKWLKRDHPGDYQAIQWLRGNAKPGAVVLEAAGPAYSYHARVATHTGLRAALGWANHESVWRGVWPTPIEADVKKMYSEFSFEAVRPLLEKYGVRYVYVGELERSDYPKEGLAKFAPALPAVYTDPAHGVTIYRVPRPGE